MTSKGNDEKKLASVLVPAYNSPNIFETLASVLMQDYADLELILVDDGSDCFQKDCVEGYIRENARSNLKRLRIHQNKKNLGVVKTMNKAFQLSTGEFIFSLAGDDCFYDEGVVSSWVKEFCANEKADVITAKRMNYDEDLLSPIREMPEKLQIHYLKRCSAARLFKKISIENFILGCCTARRRRVLEKYGDFDEAYRMIDDWPFLLKFLRAGQRIHFFDRLVIKYRGGGVSSFDKLDHNYMMENDRVFQKEVLPFVKNKSKARWDYYCWKRRKRLLHDYYSRKKSSGCADIVMAVTVRLRMPWHTLKRLFEKNIMERIIKI